MMLSIARRRLFNAVLCSRPFTSQTGLIPSTVNELEEENEEAESVTISEEEYSSTVIHGRGIHEPLYHPKTHGIPVALLHFRGYFPQRMDLYMHFVSHAAAALGIPVSKPVHLPSKRSLWTVLKGPFAHKKTQENFERIVHKRAIKAWDADGEVVDRWLRYIRRHAAGGVGIRVTRWERASVGVGQARYRNVKAVVKGVKATHAQKVKSLGIEIVQRETAVGGLEELLVTTSSTSKGDNAS